MKSVFKPLLIAALMTSVGATVLAQSAAQSGPMYAGGMMRHDRMDPAKMHEWAVQRHAELKAKLKLNANQEAAWANYVAAIQPPADMVARMSRENRQKLHEEMAALTTPERIDRMNAMKAQRDAAMARRGEATKAFYAVLSAEQQKVFDANTMRRGAGDRHHAGRGNTPQNG